MQHPLPIKTAINHEYVDNSIKRNAHLNMTNYGPPSSTSPTKTNLHIGRTSELNVNLKGGEKEYEDVSEFNQSLKMSMVINKPIYDGKNKGKVVPLSGSDL